VATIPLTAEYGDRVTRMLVINDVLFVADAGNDSNNFNAVHAAPLTAAGQEFFEQLVANLAQSGGDETPTDPAEETTDAPAGEVTEETTTEAPAEETTEAPAADGETTEAPAETEESKGGCGSAVGFGAVALLTAAAAYVASKRD
jgi:hypothetical protein